jgi:hypothetical protein
MHLIVIVSKVVKFLQLLETVRKFDGEQEVVGKTCFCLLHEKLIRILVEVNWIKIFKFSK